MHEEPVPLTEVLMALSVHDGKGIMRALRLGATLTCRRRHLPGGVMYVMHGRVGEDAVTTREHRSLGQDLMTDLNVRLEPYLRRDIL
ncbi:hypothetical protein HNQ07_002037 [Deinococcus metalli]|nr:hypothetical protein [Deinococcus metalli]MBB5376573.1 hypothetical protein [Deinococcus metalli]